MKTKKILSYAIATLLTATIFYSFFFNETVSATYEDFSAYYELREESINGTVEFNNNSVYYNNTDCYSNFSLFRDFGAGNIKNFSMTFGLNISRIDDSASSFYIILTNYSDRSIYGGGNPTSIQNAHLGAACFRLATNSNNVTQFFVHDWQDGTSVMDQTVGIDVDTAPWGLMTGEWFINFTRTATNDTYSNLSVILFRNETSDEGYYDSINVTVNSTLYRYLVFTNFNYFYTAYTTCRFYDMTFYEDGEAESIGSYNISGLDVNNRFPFSGEIDEEVWSTGNTTLGIYTNLSGTSDTCTAIHLNFDGGVDASIDETCFSFAVINATDGAFATIAGGNLSVDAGGNMTLNAANWATGLVAGWADGTCPFPIVGNNNTILVRMTCNIPSDAAPGTYTTDSWKVAWFVEE